MISASDISEIIYDACAQFGVTRYIAETFPEEEITDERIVIIPRQITDGRFWKRCFVEVNWCVPDLKGEPTARLKDVERELLTIGEGCGECDGTTYRYTKNSSQLIADKSLNLHYANLQLLFEILNTL